MKSALAFLNQVKLEFSKITWTTKKQALVVTSMVFVMVFIVALYFFVLDFALSHVVNFLLNLGD